MTHCCESSADREQLGCHDYQIARRSRHRIETCDSPSPSDFRGSRRTLLGSQLTKGGYIGIGNLRCARRTIRCARRTNCSTIASGSCPAIRQCIALARMEGTGQPREAGKTACHFRNFLISAPGHVNGSLYPLKARTYFIPSGSEHRGQKDSHEPHGSCNETCMGRTTALIEGRGPNSIERYSRFTASRGGHLTHEKHCGIISEHSGGPR